MVNGDYNEEYHLETGHEGPSCSGEISSMGRRDFMKMLGYCIGTMTLVASCEHPVHKAIPYLVQPEEITPGVSNYYATFRYEGGEFSGILVKVRDGRPIKIEANPEMGGLWGSTSARTQASILGLYDPDRLAKPMINGLVSDWETLDNQVRDKLSEINTTGKTIAILTPSLVSPSRARLIKEFSGIYENVQVIPYDTVSCSAILDAHHRLFGNRIIPSLRFREADMVVGVNCDFLGSWLNPAGFTRDYIDRKNSAYPLLHHQFESNFTITGAQAGKRIPVSPSEEIDILAEIYNYIARDTGNRLLDYLPRKNDAAIKTAEELCFRKGKSLVVSSTNDLNHQLLVCGINAMLGNYETVLDLERPVLIKQGDDSMISSVPGRMQKGEIGAMILFGVNPLLNNPLRDKWKKGFENTGLLLQIATFPDECTEFANFVCPAHHYLESWGDAMPVKGLYTLSQPLIQPLLDTRQPEDVLISWMSGKQSFHEILKNNWETVILPSAFSTGTNEESWYKALQNGFLETGETEQAAKPFDAGMVSSNFQEIQPAIREEIEYQLYESVNLGDGSLLNNVWLRELPDPVSKISWDNYAAVSHVLAEEMGWENGDMIRINNDFELPVWVQPGQASRTISVALGFARSKAGRIASSAGFDVSGLISFSKAYRIHSGYCEKLEKTGKQYELACTQAHHSMEGRRIILEYPFSEKNETEQPVSLYTPYEHPGHHWGMVIDLNRCTGCNACMIACQSENNIPVVGREEVLRGHEMSWLRIDRYYRGYDKNPAMLFQPVMCQHCDNAPCENVCPVAATSHSQEGLNQMIYNRCIGTRYCSNNCPYKVRRFNWYDYNGSDAIRGNLYDPHGMTLDLPRMVLNPDVTIRAKGVIEKCSFCVQRIQEGKNRARTENRPLQDGEVQPACVLACPSRAIVFGDMNDPESKISHLLKDQRKYHLLGELHTLPSVAYLARIRQNPDEQRNQS